MNFRSSVFFLVLLFTVLSCAPRPLDIRSIERLSISTENQDTNYGIPFNISVTAHLKNGRKKDVTGHPDIALRSDSIRPTDDRRFLIDIHPDRFNALSIPINVELLSNDEVFIWQDSIIVNNRAPIHINSFSRDGGDGLPGKQGGNTLFKRDGTAGKVGECGENGMNGGHLSVHLWREGTFVYAHVLHDETGDIWRYKSSTDHSIQFVLSGAQGGDGGNGGTGGKGKPGKISAEKAPGNGGNGGNGGAGGNGGNAGSALVFVHPNAEDLIPNISFISTPGNGGIGGQGGMAGEAGNHEAGQNPARHGTPGNPGQNGLSGATAPKSVISITAFDYKAFSD